MANRYIAHSKLHDAQAEALLWAVCSLQSVADAASHAGVSERGAAETMRRFRGMIADSNALLKSAGLPTEWPDDDDPTWLQMQDCVYHCPSEIRETIDVFDRKATALNGDRKLCTSCPFHNDMLARPLFLRTMQHLKTSGRGRSSKGFRGLFLTALIYDSYREKELNQALKSEEAMRRFGSTRHNFMTRFFEDTKAELSKAE